MLGRTHDHAPISPVPQKNIFFSLSLNSCKLLGSTPLCSNHFHRSTTCSFALFLTPDSNLFCPLLLTLPLSPLPCLLPHIFGYLCPAPARAKSLMHLSEGRLFHIIHHPSCFAVLQHSSEVRDQCRVWYQKCEQTTGFHRGCS